MKSIKPGRGPSGMSFVGSVFAVLFGIIWTIGAVHITRGADSFSSFSGMGGFGGMDGPSGIASVILPLFGLLFIGVGIVNAVYHYRNARGKDRYSIVDIVDKHEEGDPADGWIKEAPAPANHPTGKFCTECGHKLEKDYTFCPGCGKELAGK